MNFPKMTKSQLENHGRGFHQYQEHQLGSLFPEGGYTCQMCATSVLAASMPDMVWPKYDKEQLEEHGRGFHGLRDEQMQAYGKSIDHLP